MNLDSLIGNFVILQKKALSDVSSIQEFIQRNQCEKLGISLLVNTGQKKLEWES